MDSKRPKFDTEYQRQPRGLRAYREREKRETSIFRQVIGATLALLVIVGAGFLGLSFWRTWQGQTASAPAGVAASRSGESGSGDNLQDLAARLFTGLQAGSFDQPAGADPTPVKFEIRPGESAAQVADKLQRAGFIKDANSFRLLLRLQGIDTKLEAGTFELKQTMTPREIATALQRGRPASVRVTIPEGWRAEEIAALLAGQGLINQAEFMRLVKTGEGFGYPFLPPPPSGPASRLEGYLFPDTYTVDTASDTRKVVGLFLENFGNRVTPDLREAATKSQLGSLHDVVTLAAIVEREARVPSERPIIASVYLNRLKQGMKLDADPTVQYGMGFDQTRSTWWRPLTQEDYKDSSPWNTYTGPGLPPGPIASPGLDSIKAVINPASTDYLFFVARKDGSHLFAKTFEEHVRNVNAQR